MTKPGMEDIEWWITCGAAALGEQGTSGQLIEALKRGRKDCASGVPNTDLYSDRQVGFGAWRGRGLVQRSRRCRAIWNTLKREHQEALMARYASRQWPPDMRSRLGEMAGVVWLVAEVPGDAAQVEREIATHCRRGGRLLMRWIERAKIRLDQAHAAWTAVAQEAADQWVE
jgi:hypothetical protein